MTGFAVFHIKDFLRMVNEIPLSRLNLLHIIFSVLQLSVDIHITALVGCILPNRVMPCIADKEGNTINALACDRINLVNEHGRSLPIGNSQQHLLSVFYFDMLWLFIKGIALRRLRFDYRIPTGFQIGKCNFAVTVSTVCTDTLPVHFTYCKRNIFNRLSAFFINLGNNQSIQCSVGKTQLICSAVCADLNCFCFFADFVARGRLDFRYHIAVGPYVWNQDFAVAVGNKFAVGISYNRSVCRCYLKLCTCKRFLCICIRFGNQKVSVGIIRKCYLNHTCTVRFKPCLLLAVFGKQIICRRLYFFNDICACLQACDNNNAAVIGGISADNRAGVTGNISAYLSHLKCRTCKQFGRIGIGLFDNNAV